MSNRLAKETSPYLLQHKDNPVDWYPWGAEALERAKRENKPILLSVGYSACHWCHVMEHESFENPEIAKLMNDGFVNIKVDREERPDLDHIYQNVAQAMTRSGGWPLTVFLTPDLKPFFGGTYFPPDDRYGRPGFPRVLEALSEAYRNDPKSVTENAEKLTEFIQSLEGRASDQTGMPTASGLKSAGHELLSHIDWEEGGLNGAPKFPNGMIFAYLWRLALSSEMEKAGQATILALRKMAKGGIYDQLGGGFHRYSVDANWSVPHFEKMLYDNALLLKLYSEVLLTNHPVRAPLSDEDRSLFVSTLKETVEYLFREMRSPDGVFYAAQDADSEGEEGKFFVWDLKDLNRILTPEEARVFAIRYGVTEAGNFEHGKTVLYQAATLEESDARLLLTSARGKLFKARAGRIAPGRDDKVLVSWNGLAISGLVWASKAFADNEEKELADLAFKAAAQAFDFIRANLTRDGWRLSSTWQGGKPKLNGYLDDYAFMAMAALDLARATQDESVVESYVTAAQGWLDVIVRHFKDEKGGGYFFTSDDHEALIQRPKTIYDQAIPAGTSVALGCMAALAEMKPETNSLDEVHRQLSRLYPLVERNPYGYGEMLCAALLNVQGPVVVSGAQSHELCSHPHVFRKPDGEQRAAGLLVCHQRACSQPYSDVQEAWMHVMEKAERL